MAEKKQIMIAFNEEQYNLWKETGSPEPFPVFVKGAFYEAIHKKLNEVGKNGNKT